MSQRNAKFFFLSASGSNPSKLAQYALTLLCKRGKSCCISHKPLDVLAIPHWIIDFIAYVKQAQTRSIFTSLTAFTASCKSKRLTGLGNIPYFVQKLFCSLSFRKRCALCSSHLFYYAASIFWMIKQLANWIRSMEFGGKKLSSLLISSRFNFSLGVTKLQA